MNQIPDPDLFSGPSEPRRTAAEGDMALIRSILGGSEEAWQQFVLRYSGLIFAVIRRYLYSKDVDDTRFVYVEVLDHLCHGKLGQFEGRSSLATWIIVITRTETLDFLRHRFGRNEVPSGLSALSPADQRIFRLYFVEGLSIEAVLHQLSQDDAALDRRRIINALQRIEDRLDSRVLRRITYDLHAQSVGAASGRLLEYLDRVRLEFKGTEGALSPDYYLMEKEARRTAEAVQELIRRLPADEQRLLSLRFDKGWSARRISEELGIDDQRKVYTLLNRIVRSLRRRITRGKP